MATMPPIEPDPRTAADDEEDAIGDDLAPAHPADTEDGERPASPAG